MKKSTFRTYYNSKSVKLVNAIIANECLEITWKRIEDAIGDTIIEATGSANDIAILKEIYEMVA